MIKCKKIQTTIKNPGELIIIGSGISRGYLAKGSETSNNFIPNKMASISRKKNLIKQEICVDI